MNRLLLYVHFNKFNQVSSHVLYQLEKLRPLFTKVVLISNSDLTADKKEALQGLGCVDDILQRGNVGFDFAAWRDGMAHVGFDQLTAYDSVTLMNDTCFGPLWELAPIYERFEADGQVDFWGMTNHRVGQHFPEHLQSYFLVFKQAVVSSVAFQQFWQGVEEFKDVQDVIDRYETQVTTTLQAAGFAYQAVFDTTTADASGLLHPDFSYYHPTAILQQGVPFLKVKALSGNQHIAAYLFQLVKQQTSYPVSLMVHHMSSIDLPDLPYLLGQKYMQTIPAQPIKGRVAIHLHVFYVDLLEEFLRVFETYAFSYDLFITTDTAEKSSAIAKILSNYEQMAQVVVTGNKGRDIIPLLKLGQELGRYDYVGHFHTKKSKEADFWAGQSWRTELIEMLVKPAHQLLTALETQADLGLVIADIPSFFRYNKIVDAWNEHLIAPHMTELWQEMGMTKSIQFQALSTFVMSYGTFVWFKYDALKPLFELDLARLDIPEEPLPQNSVLHAMERLLVYIAWDRQYDFVIAQSPVPITPFVDNKLLNRAGNNYVNFDAMGGITGAIKYLIVGPARALKYIAKSIFKKDRL